MKKILISFLLIALIFVNAKAFAASLPNVVADGALLIDINSGKILYERNKDTKFYPASTTKIMTALLVLEHCKMDDRIIIGKRPSSFVDGSKIYLYDGEEFNVDQLMHALLIASANDVAIAFAEHISGSEEAFAQLMNERAKELGCLNTNFVNSHGLFDENHYTTPYDLSLIAREAMNNEYFRQIINTKSFSMEPTNKQPKPRPLNTINYIILNTKYHVDGANGMKTGYTSESGHSFVGSAARGDTSLIVVLLHDKKPGLWEDASSLLNYGFNSYKTIKEVSNGDFVSNLKVENTDIEIPLTAKSDFYYTYPQVEAPAISSNIVIAQDKIDSVVKGQRLGYVEYTSNGTKIGTVDLIAEEDLPASALYKYKKDVNGTLWLSYKPWLLVAAISFFAFGGLLLFKLIKHTKKSST